MWFLAVALALVAWYLATPTLPGHRAYALGPIPDLSGLRLTPVTHGNR